MKKLTIELWDDELGFLERAVAIYGTVEAAAAECIKSTRQRVQDGADKVALDLAADIANDAVAKMVKRIRAELTKEFATPPSVQRCEMVVDWKLAADGESPGDEVECGKPAVARNGHVSMCGACVKYGFEQGNFEPHELLPLQGSLVELCEANAELGAALVAAKTEKCFGCDTNERHVKAAHAERDQLIKEIRAEGEGCSRLGDDFETEIGVRLPPPRHRRSRWKGGVVRTIPEIRTDHQAATRGPWRVSMTGYSVKAGEGDEKKIVASIPHYQAGLASWMADAEFIANARQDVPDLIELVERLSAACLKVHADTGWCPACEQHDHAGDCPAGGQLTIRGALTEQDVHDALQVEAQERAVAERYRRKR